MALLEVKNLGISFGGLRAVDEFSITIEKGQLYGLIGPNGAGKTTIFNMLTGVYKPTDGTIVLDGKNITGKNTIEISQIAGIARTFRTSDFLRIWRCLTTSRSHFTIIINTAPLQAFSDCLDISSLKRQWTQRRWSF